MDAAAAAGARRCALPKARLHPKSVSRGLRISDCMLRQALFAGHCPRAHHRVSKLGDIVSFHAHCCGRHDDKVRPSQPACFICLRLI